MQWLWHWIDCDFFHEHTIMLLREPCLIDKHGTLLRLEIVAMLFLKILFKKKN